MRRILVCPPEVGPSLWTGEAAERMRAATTTSIIKVATCFDTAIAAAHAHHALDDINKTRHTCQERSLRRDYGIGFRN